MKMSSEVEKPKKTTLYLFLAIIIVILAVSTAALCLALIVYDPIAGSIALRDTPDFYMLLIGGAGFVLSAYIIFQIRGKPMRPGIKEQPVITTILCQKCGFKNVRDFQRGDYIFKEAEPCPKCNEKTSVASIYREVEKKH